MENAMSRPLFVFQIKFKPAPSTKILLPINNTVIQYCVGGRGGGEGGEGGRGGRGHITEILLKRQTVPQNLTNILQASNGSNYDELIEDTSGKPTERRQIQKNKTVGVDCYCLLL